MISAYRDGWTFSEVPGGPNGGYYRTATRNGRELPQGAMSYYALIVCLDRIAGRPCFEDFMAGHRAGLTNEEAWAQAVYTEEEAWERALAQSEGRPWIRATVAPAPEPAACTPPPAPAPAPLACAPAGAAIQASLFEELL